MGYKYGYISIGFYVSLYLTTLSSIFVALDFDLFRASTFGLDPIESVKKFCDIVENVTGSTKLPGFIRENPRVGTFAIAWIMRKFTELFRFAITLAVVPSIATSNNEHIINSNFYNSYQYFVYAC